MESITYLGKRVYPRVKKTGRFATIKSRIKAALRWFMLRLAVASVFTALLFGVYFYGMAEAANTITVVNQIVPAAEPVFPVILQKICTAESGGKQFLPNGRVVRGRVNPSDIGICQINEPIWNDKARELGLDIYTEKGNKDMALYLFNRYGTEPWNASKSMWCKGCK